MLMLDANIVSVWSVSPKIDRFSYAWWPVQVPVVTDERDVGAGERLWWIIGYFRGMVCTFSRGTNPLWIRGQSMQCAVQCHHKHDKLLGTYRDREAVSHWGGNGLFNWLPVSCEDISWLQDDCHTGVNSLLSLSRVFYCTAGRAVLPFERYWTCVS